jgi:hypothetical protein
VFEERKLAEWEWPWWRSTSQDVMVLPWFILIHLTAVVGLIFYPLPGGSFSGLWG